MGVICVSRSYENKIAKEVSLTTGSHSPRRGIAVEVTVRTPSVIKAASFIGMELAPAFISPPNSHHMCLLCQTSPSLWHHSVLSWK